jgi:putative addiction module killer protein
MEKIWPALEHVDSSSGALGAAVNKALDALIPIIVNAPSDEKTRDKWLDRLWQAMADDGVDYLRLDVAAAVKVATAVHRMEQDNFSNVKGVGAGVYEYRIDFGPGYRIYFGKDGVDW